jgi:hypothetical protein
MINALLQSLAGLLALELAKEGVCTRTMLIKLCGSKDKSSIHKECGGPNFKQTLQKSLKNLQDSKEIVPQRKSLDVVHEGPVFAREGSRRDSGKGCWCIWFE